MKNQEEIRKVPRFIRYALAAYNRRGYVGAMLCGEFAKGKTVTAMKMAGKILQVKYGYTEEQALDIVIDDYMIFTSDDFLSLTERIYGAHDWENMEPEEVLKTKFNIRLPVLIWDDAGIHASSKKEQFDKQAGYDIQSNYDTIRDITSCMILTVPEEGELMKFLRQYRSNYFVELATPHGVGDPDKRIMYFYKYERDKKSGNMKRKFKYGTDPEQSHSIHISNYLYGKYDKKRTLAKLNHDAEYKRKKEEREIMKQYELMKKKHAILKMKRELDVMQKKEEKMVG